MDYLVCTSLRANNILPPHPSVLELGESNWYGDVSAGQLDRDIQQLPIPENRRHQLSADLRESYIAQRPNHLYEIARIFFNGIIDASKYSAIDPGTPSAAYTFNLNHPLPLDEVFDITINIGTAEHVFNVQQFFKSAHDCTMAGGLMIHCSPFLGWTNHGFYNFQPTFFFDLALANQYEIVSMVIGRIKPFQYVQIQSHEHFMQELRAAKIPGDSHIHTVFRKPPRPLEFAMPMQGYYAGTLSPEMKKMWHEMR